MLQYLVCTEAPWQRFPPYLGAGLLQYLRLVCFPPPQDLEHLDHLLHLPYFPSTVKNNNVCLYNLLCSLAPEYYCLAVVTICNGRLAECLLTRALVSAVAGFSLLIVARAVTATVGWSWIRAASLPGLNSMSTLCRALGVLSPCGPPSVNRAVSSIALLILDFGAVAVITAIGWSRAVTFPCSVLLSIAATYVTLGVLAPR